MTIDNFFFPKREKVSGFLCTLLGVSSLLLSNADVMNVLEKVFLGFKLLKVKLFIIILKEFDLSDKSTLKFLIFQLIS